MLYYFLKFKKSGVVILRAAKNINSAAKLNYIFYKEIYMGYNFNSAAKNYKNKFNLKVCRFFIYLNKFIYFYNLIKIKNFI